MLPRKLLPFTTLLLGLLGLLLLAQTLPAHSQGNPAADLVLYKAVTPLTALAPGDEIQYTLTFSNAGVLTATDVLISDTLPSLLTDVIVTSTLPLTPTGNAWAVGILPPGAGGIITLTGAIFPALTSELIFTNTATITSPITDTQPANNTSFVVSEVNLPPTVHAGPDAILTEGQIFTLLATFTDPGLDDTHTATIAWGDTLTGTGVLSETAHTLVATHTYTTTGVFTIMVWVTDSDGGQGNDLVQLTVQETEYLQYLPIVSNYFGNPLNYVQVSPLPNSLNVLSLSPVSAEYGVNLWVGNLENFVVHSLQTGILTGTFEHAITYEGDVLTLTSAEPLRAGETIQATLTTGITALLGEEIIHPDYPKVWQFTVGTTGGSGYMMPAPTPSFGGGASTDLAWGDVDRDGDGDVIVTNLDGPATVWLNDGQGTFAPHPTTPELGAGGEQAVALGDLDNDGDVDAVLATFGAESVWLNDRAGNFSPHPIVPTFGAGDSLDVALGDLNGDSFLDAVLANTNGDPETVWLNDGTGAFVPHPVLPAFGAGDSTGVALGDVDGDFDLDAVVANTNGEPETVWLNDSTGQFAPHETMPTFGAGTSQAVRLGDLDRDGDMDAVVANASGEPETVWMNDGTGNFSSHPVISEIGVGDSTDLALGDLEGDGDLDVVVANANGEPETVWLNDGAGGFFEYPGNPMFGEGDSQGVVLGDGDGDGDLDVIVANFGAETVWAGQEMKVTATTPAGNGGVISQDGTILVIFDAPVDISTVNTFTFAVRGAFTGDYSGTFSFPAPNQVLFTPAMPFLPGEDIIITLSRLIRAGVGFPLKPFTWEMRTAVNGGTGEVTVHPGSPFGEGWSFGAALGDVDGDRDLDAMVAELGYENEAAVWLNDGDGYVTKHPIAPVTNGIFSTDVVLGDLDRDGDLDAIVGGWITSTVWLNDGGGGFQPHPAFPNFGIENGSHDIQLADLDGDGDLDAVICHTVNNEWSIRLGGQVWLNDGTGGFFPHPLASSFGEGEIFTTLELGDIDQDGDLDAVTGADWVGGTKLWLNGGYGNFTLLTTLDPTASDVELADLDGDLDLDLLFAFPTLFDDPLGASVWLNDGSGSFSIHPNTPIFGGTATIFSGFTLGDVDGDGDLDALFATSDVTTHWVNDGEGNFTPHPSYPAEYSENYAVKLGDIDGDGDLDILMTGFGFGLYGIDPAFFFYQNE